MRLRHLAIALAVASLLLGGLLVPAPRARAAEACFAETGHCVRAGFLDYWLAHGGLAINGYPLSEERPELLEDGKQYTVQYFERVRMERHPENPPPWDIELGQFGRRVLRDSFGYEVARYQAAVAPAQPVAGQAFFPQTSHNVPPDFAAYWQANGGLARFGYPLSELIAEALEDGKRYQVQYFERARFELHPENPAPYDILLGQFGRGILAQTDRLSGRFGPLYITDERVRGLLGAPALFPAFQSQGATQAFERGRMFFWREPSGFPLIAALCGDAAAGQVFTTSRLTLYFADTWDPSQPAGGGPGPRPGLYEPTRGFGKIWRETRDYLAGETSPTLVRDCLGYATTPDETAYTITVQYFARGLLLSAPDDQVAYVLYGEARPGGGLLGRYERDTLPAR